MGATVSLSTTSRSDALSKKNLPASAKKLKRGLAIVSDPLGSIKRWSAKMKQRKAARLQQQQQQQSQRVHTLSSNELMQRFSKSICRQCDSRMKVVPNDIERWIRSVDETLIMQGWQDHEYVSESSLVFMYMMAKATCTESQVSSLQDLKMTVLICLFLGFSYTGNEISYPLKPFLCTADKKLFWDRCMQITLNMSSQMLRLNSDSDYYHTIRQELYSQ
ncbi:cyclin-dependent kinase 5 activator 2-like [Corticium candelabrum]|uniref:cyclin-dependent kinase 5 activator 2-like n=1 Tax=Corticium candelabrum TaxID=121492 RepID=UPI002E259D5B|nr:cyclin-dependent kinase 5 activator 2-like [Corticium candelabrum]